jgi:hypothetical protein
MNIKIKKETKITDGTSFYCVYVDGIYICGSSSEKTANYMFDQLIKSDGKELSIETIREENI